MPNKHLGSSFDSFLEEEGLYSEVKAVAIKRVLSYRLQEWMKDAQISKSEMADKMKTSRSSIDRLLDPDNTSITLNTLARAATIVGKKLDIRFIN
ncbi:MAG: XRE family transcriptional regulator [Gammaproteobacteria bacterium]|nr:XRE family transcriptional regulator [Gammaproteobacteria bacterium]